MAVIVVVDPRTGEAVAKFLPEVRNRCGELLIDPELTPNCIGLLQRQRYTNEGCVDGPLLPALTEAMCASSAGSPNITRKLAAAFSVTSVGGSRGSEAAAPAESTPAELRHDRRAIAAATTLSVVRRGGRRAPGPVGALNSCTTAALSPYRTSSRG